ncbi:hypothetical protein GCM10022252_16120 [Streptosporangium oxazolinicum]|uniref:Uncharacterized protein n=1 Tax=Streptosporangium oxazolinicum TaxID=909287 RepID=A0ABP8AKI4_9ACTN
MDKHLPVGYDCAGRPVTQATREPPPGRAETEGFPALGAHRPGKGVVR